MSANKIILSNKQQKHALSAKKKPKENVRNILANPYSRHWPHVSEEHDKKLKDILKEHLPILCNKRISIPINIIRNVDKTERKSARARFREYQTQTLIDESVLGKVMKSNIILGINAVTKRLEKKEICTVLVSADASPQFMVQHVIDLAVINKVPVLVVPELNNFLKKYTSVSSLILGLQNCVKTDSKLAIVLEAVKNIATNYQVTDDNAHNLTQGLTIEHEINDSGPSDLHTDNFIYLNREDDKNRVFVPPNSSKVSKMDVDLNDDFISFSSDCNKNTSKLKYQSLKVKRVRSNKDRPNKKNK